MLFLKKGQSFSAKGSVVLSSSSLLLFAFVSVADKISLLEQSQKNSVAGSLASVIVGRFFQSPCLVNQ